jgi:hypothetical protein
VVTVVLWAVARPFRRLVSMVSLTREQFGGIVPGVGGGPMSRTWQRIRGGPAEDRQSRWWDERQGTAYGADPDATRPETVAATATVVGGGSAARQVRRRAEVTAPSAAAVVPAARRPALPSGGDGHGSATTTPGRSDPGEIDERVIYRRPDAVPARAGGARAVQPELVDGVQVYRIYRPRAAQPAYGRPEDG